jgi:hypothetical protein
MERITEQISVVVAATRLKHRALMEKGFCGRDIRAELIGTKFGKMKENSVNILNHRIINGNVIEV